MEYVKLNNGVEMPMLGYGVYQVLESIRFQKKILRDVY